MCTEQNVYFNYYLQFTRKYRSGRNNNVQFHDLMLTNEHICSNVLSDCILFMYLFPENTRRY